MTATKRLRWRREPYEKGLARLTQGERGYDLWYGETRVASVSLAYTLGRVPIGWYWSSPEDAFGTTWRNTAAEGKYYKTADAAKADAMAYAREQIKLKEQKP